MVDVENPLFAKVSGVFCTTRQRDLRRNLWSRVVLLLVRHWQVDLDELIARSNFIAELVEHQIR
jgi:hypothetical protein